MDERFKINRRRENRIYLACFLLSGIINVAFWFSLPGIIRDCYPGDEPFIVLAGLAAAGSLIGLTIHWWGYRNLE